jgi:hypothetical protein
VQEAQEKAQRNAANNLGADVCVIECRTVQTVKVGAPA